MTRLSLKLLWYLGYKYNLLFNVETWILAFMLQNLKLRLSLNAHLVRMPPKEEHMTRRSPLDFSIVTHLSLFVICGICYGCTLHFTDFVFYNCFCLHYTYQVPKICWMGLLISLCSAWFLRKFSGKKICFYVLLCLVLCWFGLLEPEKWTQLNGIVSSLHSIEWGFCFLSILDVVKPKILTWTFSLFSYLFFLPNK